MSIRSNFSLRGMAEWLEKIAQAGDDVDGAAARAVTAGGDRALQGMRKRAPELTGNLKEKLSIKGPIQDGNFVYVWVGLIHDIEYTDAETARYGMAQEFGTANMAAHPYIRPTLKNDKRYIRAKERESLKEDAIL